MARTPPSWLDRPRARRAAGMALLAAGTLGVVAGLAVTVIGWRLVGSLDASVGRSLALTAEALVALDGSLQLSADTVAVLDRGLADVRRATDEAATALTDGERLVGDSARLTGTRLADAVAAVDRSLPAVERVAAVIDDTLVALDALPVGPEYDPEEPFDASIRDLAGALRGVPEELRAQSEVLEGVAASLGDAGRSAGAVAEDVGVLDAQLDEAADLLTSYAATGERARTLVAGARDQMAGQVAAGRLAVAALGMSAALGQIVPLAAGWWLLRGRDRTTGPA